MPNTNSDNEKRIDALEAEVKELKAKVAELSRLVDRLRYPNRPNGAQVVDLRQA